MRQAWRMARTRHRLARGGHAGDSEGNVLCTPTRGSVSAKGVAVDCTYDVGTKQMLA